MKQNDILNTIHTQFDSCAKDFCQRTRGESINISSDYKGEEIPKNLEYRFAQIFYENTVVEFRYTAHGTLGLVNSILECMVYTDKTDDAVAIPLQFACEYFKKTPGIPLSIPLISTADGMKEAFRCLENAVAIIFDDLNELSGSTYLCEKLCDFFGDELYRIYGLDRPEDIIVTDSDYKFLTLHFVSDYYLNFFRNDKKTALKRLEKFKRRSSYDDSVLSIWKGNFSFSAIELPALRKSAEGYNKSGTPKNNSKEFLATFLSWLFLTPVFGIIYVGLYYLLMLIEGQDSVYLMGPMMNLPFCFMPSFISSIAASYFLRLKAMKLFFKKDYDKFCEMDSIANGGGSDKVMGVFLWITIFASLIFCILFPKWNVNFKEDGFVDNSEFFALKGEYHEYSDIKRVYYIGERTNDLGDVLDFPSYVMELRDGTEIDFYEFDDIASYENKLIDHLRSKGVKIEGPKK